jgi:hypothetical protein
MRPPRIGMYVTAALMIALVVTCALRAILSSWDWTGATWAIVFGSSLAAALVILYAIGATTRARTERRAFGPGPSVGGPGDDPVRRD